MGEIYHKSGSLQKGGVRVGVVQVVLRGDCNSYNTIVCMYVRRRGGYGRLIRPHPSCKNLYTYKSVPCLYICIRYKSGLYNIM